MTWMTENICRISRTANESLVHPNSNEDTKYISRQKYSKSEGKESMYSVNLNEIIE